MPAGDCFFLGEGGVLKQHPPLYNFTKLYVGTENPMVKFNCTILAVIWPIENTHLKMQEKLRSYMILNYHGISNVDADTPNLFFGDEDFFSKFPVALPPYLTM